MQTYEAKVRLGGSLYNEVHKAGVTAAEVAVLRAIHGSDAIVHLKAKGGVERTDKDERVRLHELYGPALASIESVKNLAAVLGHESIPLPKTIEGVDTLPAPKTGRRATAQDIQAPEPVAPIQPAEFA